MKKNVLLLPVFFSALRTLGANSRLLPSYSPKTDYVNPQVKVIFFVLVFILLNTIFVTKIPAQTSTPPALEWNKTLGSNGEERLYSIRQTADGGYIMAGSSPANANGEKTENSKGGHDLWIVKLNATGIKEWDKTIGGSSDDYDGYIEQTADGGYIIGGVSLSTASGDKSENSKGIHDYWIVKLSATGHKEWDKTIGGSGGDFLFVVHQTTDGGYILGGYSLSNASGDKSENSKSSYSGWSDYWVVKLNATGNKEWDKTIGGNYTDWFTTLQQTADGGYILGGSSSSMRGGDKSEDRKVVNDNKNDFWVVKLNSAGTKEWDKTIGGNGEDNLHSLVQTSDGGYILGGPSVSDASGDKTENSKGYTDYWVVKLNATGGKVWDRTIGGDGSDYLMHLQQTNDSGYILGGMSSSNVSGDKSENTIGSNFNSDYWVVKLNSTGIKEWDNTIGGPGRENLMALQQTTDGGYILGGISDSEAGADKTENSRGANDYWVVKLRGTNTLPNNLCNLALTSKVTQAEPWYGRYPGGGGAIDLTVTGGTAPYMYNWNNSPTTQDISGLAPGVYTVVVTDAKGCKAWGTVEIGKKNDPMRLHTSKIDLNTNGDPVGSIDLTVVGGTGPYKYLWSNGATSEDLTGLGVGTYSVTVTDAFNRKLTTSVTIVNPRTPTPAVCNLVATSKVTPAESWYGMWGPTSGAGAIDVTSSGGTGPYTYKWNTGATTEDLAIAAPGVYTLTITDAKACITSTTVTVSRKNGPLSLAESHTNVTAGGANNGSIDLSVVGGTGPFRYRWSNGVTTEDLTGLAAGTYSVTVSDAFNRTATISVQILGAGTTAMASAKSPGNNEIFTEREASFSVYPNPVKDQASIQFTMQAAGKYTLDLYDIRGAKVRTLVTGQGQANESLDIAVPVNNLAEGIYLLKLQTDKELTTRRISIIR